MPMQTLYFILPPCALFYPHIIPRRNSSPLCSPIQLLCAHIGSDIELIRPPPDAPVGERVTFEGIHPTGALATPNQLKKNKQGKVGMSSVDNWTTHASERNTE